MKKTLLTMAIWLVVLPSIAAQNDAKTEQSIPTICNGKLSAESYIQSLSDYELVRGITNVMANIRMAPLRTSNDLQLWLQTQPDCAVWTEGTYLIEVKWLHKEAVARGLSTTINKIGQGDLRWNSNQDRLEERNEKNNWAPWRAYQK